MAKILYFNDPSGL